MRVLFVCTGNTCRSAMSEAIARAAARRRGMAGVTFLSAGTSAWEGAPASDAALLVGIERKLDLNAHRARVLSRALIEESDLILGMAPHHVERINVLGGDGKAHLLADYAAGNAGGASVDDPFGGDLDRYRATADELEAMITRVLDRIAPAADAT